MNLICWLFGHKVILDADDGYAVCDRCGSHEYYDPEEWGHGVEGILLPQRIIHVTSLRKVWWWAQKNAYTSDMNAPWNQVADDDICF